MIWSGEAKPARKDVPNVVSAGQATLRRIVGPESGMAVWVALWPTAVAAGLGVAVGEGVVEGEGVAEGEGWPEGEGGDPSACAQRRREGGDGAGG